MTSESPDEDRIRRAVADAVDALDGPDRARLARIERQLLERHARRRPGPWRWGVLLAGLAAGAAAAYWATSAGWWIGDQPADDNVPEASGPAPVRDDDAMTGTASDATAGDEAGSRKQQEMADTGDGEADAQRSTGDDDGPVIYIAP